MNPSIATLRAELRADSAFVATPSPRLSWTVTSAEDGWRQTAVELASGDERTTLDTSESVFVAWPFAPLAPGEEREVRVRATAASGTVTEWSEPLRIVAGFLAEGAW